MPATRLLRYARLDNANLRDNAKHRTAASHALKIYASGSIYSFIPKNACSTMRLSLAIANGCIAGPSDIEWIHRNNDTFRASLEDLARAPYTFVILRDPFARLASCFLDKIVAKAPPAFRLAELSGQAVDLDQISFAGFIELLTSEPVRNGNIHWRKQTDFLVYERYDDYFAVENFVGAAASIRHRAGLEVVDARPLTAHGLDRYRILPASFDHSATPAGEIARLKHLGECPHPRSLYTQSIVESVTRIYADDIDLYAETIGLPTLFTPGHTTSR